MAAAIISRLAGKLRDLGVGPGKVVYAHTELTAFVEAARSAPVSSLPGLVINAIQQAGGGDATLVMPTFTYSCSSFGHAFDLENTPSETGVISEHLRTMPGACRSLHPTNSVAAWGPLSRPITQDAGLSNYGWDSPFDRMAELGAMVLSMGLPGMLSNSFTHYAEVRFGAPYRYHKLLDYIPVTSGGRRIQKDFTMAVRYLDAGVASDLKRLHDPDLEASGLLRRDTWAGGELRALDVGPYLKMVLSGLKRDPYYLLSGKPSFIRGRPPADGPADPSPGQ